MTADADVPFPTVPRERLERGGWALADESVETLFRLPGLSVHGATCRFRDARTAEATREFVDVDTYWRFFAATALSLDPGLPPAASRTFLLPTVRAKAVESFRSALRERGLTDVRRSRTERIALASDERVPVTGFRATFANRSPRVTVPVVAWVGVWHADGFRVGSGAYPARPLGDVLGVEDPPPVLARDAADYRDELFDLLAAVE